MQIEPNIERPTSTKRLARVRILALVPVVSLFMACGGAPEPAAEPAAPADPTVVDSAHYSVIADNPAVRILKVSYGAGESSTMHYHPDAIAVSLADGTFRFTLPDGTTRDATLPANAALYMPAETHNPQNAGSERSELILVEFKAAEPGMGTLPAAREGLAMTVLAEGPRATAYNIVSDPTFAEPEGTTHDYDQVVIALGPGEVDLTINGNLVRGTWARGDVEFIGRGVPHSATNRGGTAVEYVLIGIK
jgi:quercetin dioxygenase-like cupin family protein